MINKYWWILPLLAFVIPIVYGLARVIAEKHFPAYEPYISDSGYDFKQPDRIDIAAVYVIGWVISAGLILGHYL